MKISIFSKKRREKNTPVKKNRLILNLIIVFLGIGLAVSGAMLSFESQTVYNENLVDENFANILLTAKCSVETEFQSLLDEVKNDPLGGLYDEKLPSVEEMFYEEWANDWFPVVEIPVIGGYIQEECAEIIGDVDLDNQMPYADLNISYHANPSGLTINQCQALWNPSNSLSLVTSGDVMWLDAIGNGNYNNILMLTFNLSESQLHLIINWINVSQLGWMNFYANEAEVIVNPLFLSVSIAIGGITLFFALNSLRSYFKLKRSPKSD